MSKKLQKYNINTSCTHTSSFTSMVQINFETCIWVPYLPSLEEYLCK